MLRSWQAALENTNSPSTFLPTRVAVSGCETARWPTETPGDLCYICPLERAEICTSPSEEIQFPICPITILSFIYCYKDISCKYWTGLSKNLIYWAFRNFWKPVSTANEIKTAEIWQIEKLLKTVQQPMQLVSILAIKKYKINFKINFW